MYHYFLDLMNQIDSWPIETWEFIGFMVAVVFVIFYALPVALDGNRRLF